MTATPPGLLRVLLVEDDPQQRANSVDLLAGWHYEVYVAGVPEGAVDAHKALLEDAKQKARAHRCHLAIVDMRLNVDSDEPDTSGLKLVPDLVPTVSIIRSGYGDRKTVRDALNPSLDVPERAYDFVGKEEGAEALKNVIEAAMNKFWPYLSKKTSIKWPYSIPSSGHLIKRFFPDHVDIPEEEIEDLLWRLCPEAEELSVEALENDDRSPSTGLRPRSIVFRIREDDRRHDIVKVTRSDRSLNEYEKFADYVEGKFPGRYYAVLKKVETLWDTRGARYEHIGDWGKMILFSTYYRSRSDSEIRAVLKRFGKDWKEHYARTRQIGNQNTTLYNLYREIWGENWHKRLVATEDSLSKASSEFQSWFTDELKLDDAIVWLKKRVRIDEDCRIDRSPSSFPTVVLHGDLHGDNCFVDEEHGNLWLIDFERSGPGPIVADWVELEIDVLTRLSCFSVLQRKEYLALLVCLLSPRSDDFWLPVSHGALNAEAAKSLAVITEIRKQAKQTTGLGNDTRLYRWALLLNAIFRLTLPVASKDEDKTECGLSIIERCAQLGGVVCRSLESEGKDWPPMEWKDVLDRPSPASNYESPNDIEAIMQQLDTNKRLLLQLEQQSILAIGSEAAILAVHIGEKKEEIANLERRIDDLDLVDCP